MNRPLPPNFWPGFLQRSAPPEVEEFLDTLLNEIAIPETKYDSAEKSYRSVGDWLSRAESKVARFRPEVYSQGSFRLGTAIRPLTEADEYDVDAVCELRIEKHETTQRILKGLVGDELHAYVVAKSMNKGLKECRRCWTLTYADGSQFHLDVVPAVPNVTDTLALLRANRFDDRALGTLGINPAWLRTAIAITDKTHPTYNRLSSDWPRSNPKGYCEWFRSRMAAVLEARKRTKLGTGFRAGVEAIPDYKVRTPLQAAVMFLKRHRDVMFTDDAEHAPISIVITTLAAHAYNGETTTSAALTAILRDMPNFIQDRGGQPWIANPVDPIENFADKWAEHPEREVAFRHWLERARADFGSLVDGSSRSTIIERLTSLGYRAVNRALARKSFLRGTDGRALRLADIGRMLLLGASHRRRPVWREQISGAVSVAAAFERPGFRSEAYPSDGRHLEKEGTLRFAARTDVPHPFKIYWQVVNSGEEAEAAACLRGRFQEGVERGGLIRTETTRYRGSHTVQCFIVRNGVVAAKSSLFVVNIR